MRILTFDIEDWFHILHKYPENILEKWGNYEVRIHNGMDRIFKVLIDNNIKATFFVVGYIARKHPEIIRKMKGCCKKIIIYYFYFGGNAIFCYICT